MGKLWKQWLTLFFGGSRITADGDCSHEIKRRAPMGLAVPGLVQGGGGGVRMGPLSGAPSDRPRQKPLFALLFPGARSQRASDLNACPWRLRTRWWVWPRPPRGRPSLLSQVGGRGRLSLPELQLPFRLFMCLLAICMFSFKLKSFWTMKETISKVKRQPSGWVEKLTLQL